MSEAHTTSEKTVASGGGLGAGIGLGVAGLDILSGLFGFLAGEEIAGITASRGRMLRDEAEADAQRFAEEVRGFKASQKLKFLKSGVTLSGSPLDILDETARIGSENISAIRARGRGVAAEQEIRGGEAVSRGRAALISGFSGATSIGLRAFRQAGRVEELKTPRNI